MLLPHTIYTQLLAMMPHACSLLIAADALDDDVMMISYYFVSRGYIRIVHQNIKLIYLLFGLFFVCTSAGLLNESYPKSKKRTIQKLSVSHLLAPNCVSSRCRIFISDTLNLQIQAILSALLLHRSFAVLLPSG